MLFNKIVTTIGKHTLIAQSAINTFTTFLLFRGFSFGDNNIIHDYVFGCFFFNGLFFRQSCWISLFSIFGGPVKSLPGAKASNQTKVVTENSRSLRLPPSQQASVSGDAISTHEPR